MKGLSIIAIGLVVVSFFLNMQTHAGLKNRLSVVETNLAAYKVALKAKPALIKFYTVRGYDCNTSVIPGHCIKQDISQAEYDKKNSHLFKVTDN